MSAGDAFADLLRQIRSLSRFTLRPLDRLAHHHSDNDILELYVYFWLCGWRLNQWLYPPAFNMRPNIPIWTNIQKSLRFPPNIVNVYVSMLSRQFSVPLPRTSYSPRKCGLTFQHYIQVAVNNVSQRKTNVPLPFGNKIECVWEHDLIRAASVEIVSALTQYGVTFVVSELTVVLGRRTSRDVLGNADKLSVRLDHLVVRNDGGLVVVEMKYHQKWDGPTTRDVAQVHVQALALYSATGILVRDCWLLYYNESRWELFGVSHGGADARTGPIHMDLLSQVLAHNSEQRRIAIQTAKCSMCRRMKAVRRQGKRVMVVAVHVHHSPTTWCLDQSKVWRSSCRMRSWGSSPLPELNASLV